MYHGSVMAYRQSGKGGGETGSGSQRQGHHHGRQQERNIFGRQDLPAGYGQQTVARHSAITVETEERLRISREREHDHDRHGQQGLAWQQSRGPEAQAESAHHRAAPEIESRKRLAQILANEMIQRAGKVGHAAPHSLAGDGKRRQQEPNGKHPGGQRPKSQRHMLPNGQRHDEPRDGIQPRAEDSQQPALTPAEWPDVQAIARQNAQRIGAQWNKEDQSDDRAKCNEGSRLAAEKKCGTSYEERSE